MSSRARTAFLIGRRARRARMRQCGQALALGMAVTLVALLALSRYFSLGQVVGVKARHMHALDAATYSGALVQARALNMLALINRAQIGHQVALAHLVTLGSWATLAGTESGQLRAGNPPAYLIAMMFGAGHGQAYLAAGRSARLQSMAASHGSLAAAYAAHESIVHETLTAVQDAIVSGLPHARRAAIEAVLQENLPEPLPFDLLIEDDGWQDYLEYRSARQWLTGFLSEVVQQYGFLDPRDRTARNPWIVSARCPWMRHELRRRGTTRLDSSGRWTSMDTQSFHAVRSNRWIGCYRREYPMGWGWIPPDRLVVPDHPYSDAAPDDFSAQDFWRWVRDATSWDIVGGVDNPLANSRAVASRSVWSSRGLPVYLDVRNRPAGQPHALRFRAHLKHPGPDGLVIHTRSAASAYFKRPQARQDGMHELPSLFHPYWQARLEPDDVGLSQRVGG